MPNDCQICGKPSKLQCPKCVQLKLPAAHFCSQECFKSSWGTHKNVHTVQQALTANTTGLPEEFIGYNFSGNMRPYRISPRRPIPDHIVKPFWHETGGSSPRGNPVIPVIEGEELVKSKTVCKMARECLTMAGSMVDIGVTTEAIDAAVHEFIISKNAYPSPLNYGGFRKSCCTSVNEVICHGIPDERPLEDGDIINIDVSIYYDGYHADLNETFLVGNVNPRTKHLVDTCRNSLYTAIQACKPKMLYRELGNIISKVVHKEGFSVVRTYCGHGTGSQFHQPPNIPHYAKNKAVGIMKPGHIFTIEPMINEGVWQDQLWPDDWTSATRDGKNSAQFEHTLLITETGCEVLTARPEEEFLNH